MGSLSTAASAANIIAIRTIKSLPRQSLFGEHGGTYIQDLTWLLIVWIHCDRPARRVGSWLAALGEPEYIMYKCRKSGAMKACTHAPIFGSIFSAWKKLTQDLESGELGTKVTAHAEYRAVRRQVTRVDTGGT